MRTHLQFARSNALGRGILYVDAAGQHVAAETKVKELFDHFRSAYFVGNLKLFASIRKSNITDFFCFSYLFLEILLPTFGCKTKTSLVMVSNLA